MKVATDAIDFGWGGHSITGVSNVAHEYFSECVGSRPFLNVSRIGGRRHVLASTTRKPMQGILCSLTSESYEPPWHY